MEFETSTFWQGDNHPITIRSMFAGSNYSHLANRSISVQGLLLHAKRWVTEYFIHFYRTGISVSCGSLV